MEIKHFDPKAFDFGKKKAFPMRPGHFFTSCEKAMTELDWNPEFDTLDGLRDSYENDFVHKKANFLPLLYCTIVLIVLFNYSTWKCTGEKVTPRGGEKKSPNPICSLVGKPSGLRGLLR